MKTCSSFTRILALALALAAGRARADEEARFQRHYQPALSLYNNEEYEAAIREFQAAYAIRARPRLLFNIGQAYRHLGNAKEALRFFLMYQAMEPNQKPGLKAELEGYIEQMQEMMRQADRAKQLEEEQQPPPTQPPALAPAPIDPQPPPARQARLDFNLAPSADVAVAAAAPVERPSVVRKAWFWVVIASAVTALALSIGIAVAATRGPSYGGDIRNVMFGN